MILPVIKGIAFGKSKKRHQANNKDLSQKELIPIRHIDFKFVAKEVDPKFYMRAELITAGMDALSIFLTYGEELVIETARYHRDFLTDPVLKQRVTALIGQEATHSKVHEEWNDVLKQRHFPVTFFRFIAQQVLDYGLRPFPPLMKLSMIAGFEHFTAVLAEFTMKHEDNLFQSPDEKQRWLWMWHMLEESEHKDVAYDLYQTLSGNYLLRISGFAVGSMIIFGAVPLGAVFTTVYRKPSQVFRLRYWKDVKRSLRLLLNTTDGIVGSTFSHMLDYLRPDFHPNDHDTSEYVAYYKERLLNPKTGLLTPYLIKEVIPPVRAI